METLSDHELLLIPSYLPLRDYQLKNGRYTVDLGAGRDYKRLELDEKSFKVLKLFLSPNTMKDAAKRTNIPFEDVQKFCDCLKHERLLIPYQSCSDAYEKYSRHLQYYGLCGLDPIVSQDRLNDLTITLIGVGGIGNWIGLNLIGLGIKKLKLIDSDTIEESNLPRQILFNENDIGKFKVDVAARELRKRKTNLDLEIIKDDATESNIFELVSNSDFVVLSADKPFFKIQKWTNAACVKYKTPLLNVGYAAEEGMMGPLVVPEFSSCLACNSNLDENNYHLKNNAQENPFMRHFIPPSFVCLNSLISSMASYEIVKYFLNFGECISLNNLVRINPRTFSINKIPHLKDPLCTMCNHIQ